RRAGATPAQVPGALAAAGTPTGGEQMSRSARTLAFALCVAALAGAGTWVVLSRPTGEAPTAGDRPARSSTTGARPRVSAPPAASRLLRRARLASAAASRRSIAKVPPRHAR